MTIGPATVCMLLRGYHSTVTSARRVAAKRRIRGAGNTRRLPRRANFVIARIGPVARRARAQVAGPADLDLVAMRFVSHVPPRRGCNSHVRSIIIVTL